MSAPKMPPCNFGSAESIAQAQYAATERVLRHPDQDVRRTLLAHVNRLGFIHFYPALAAALDSDNPEAAMTDLAHASGRVTVLEVPARGMNPAGGALPQQPPQPPQPPHEKGAPASSDRA